jgi:ATP-dependent exoDNAse (exonuclease V) beta subunit
MDEEERLLYVAVTRAKENLFLSLYHKGSGKGTTDSLCHFLQPANVRAMIDEQSLTPAFERLLSRGERRNARR